MVYNSSFSIYGWQPFFDLLNRNINLVCYVGELIGYFILNVDVALTFVTAVGKKLIDIGVVARDTIAAMFSACLF